MTTAPTDLASATTLVEHLRRQRQARLIETHISWVLLDGQDAWKLKKPLHLPSLDASTLARRQRERLLSALGTQGRTILAAIEVFDFELALSELNQARHPPATPQSVE